MEHSSTRRSEVIKLVVDWAAPDVEELEGADLSLVVLRHDLPHCKIHGAMNQVSPHGLWRCISTYSRERDNDCRAGCILKEDH